MRPTSRPRSSSLLVTAAGSLALTAAAVAGPATTAPLHGGVVTATRTHVFETVLAADGVHIYLFTDEKAPAMVERATGTAHLSLPDGRTVEVALTARKPAEGAAAVYFCPMHTEVVQDHPGECNLCGGMTLFTQDDLFGPADLAGVDLAKVQAMIRITGLRGPEKDATFSPAFSTPAEKAGR